MEISINTQNSKYVKGGTNMTNFPEWELPEVMLCGRSNVGKSSFINMMLGINGIAKVSCSPGKTRVLNFFDVDGQMSFVDVPGYGYARVQKNLISEFAKMIDEYVQRRPNLKLIVLLIDSKVGPTKDDIDMYNFLAQSKKPVLIVFTKWDKLNQKEKSEAKKRIMKKLNLPSEENYIPFSSEKQINKDLVWECILDFAFNE